MVAEMIKTPRVAKPKVIKPTPNVVMCNGPFPGRREYWPEGTYQSARMRMGWTFGRYILAQDNEHAYWKETVPESMFKQFNEGQFQECY